MKPIDVWASKHIDIDAEITDTDLKCKSGDHVIISKHQNILAKVYTPIWSEEVFAIKDLKIPYNGYM